MKKIYILLFAFLFFGTAKAQFTKLHDFDGNNGSRPYGSVTLSANDSILYGMTTEGGALSNSFGVLYSMNTDGSAFTVLHTFTTDAISGSRPYGSLIRSGNKLYGMTSYQGANGSGTIFSINTDGSGYTKLYDFTGYGLAADSSGAYFAGGAQPLGTLTISGNLLYGATAGWGGNDHGNIFSIHTDGSAYTPLHTFNGTDGEAPGYGALILSGNTLYGTTMHGGINNDGVLFSIQTDGSAYTKLIDFNNANGLNPSGTVALSGNVLFGAANGGFYNKGIIYSVHTDGTGYKKLLDFNGTNGQDPIGTLILSGVTLYGTTMYGGTNNLGTVFSIDTSGTGFQTLFSFNTPDGTQPQSALSLAGTMLYGTCVYDGAYAKGTIFSIMTQPPLVPICMVTVDDSSRHNKIIWEKPVSASIDSFIVYREITTNNYLPIAAVPYSSLSEFVDTVEAKYFPFTGNPNSGTYRYKLQVRDTNGTYSALSPYHNTIFVTQSGGNFNWNHYGIEGDPVPLPGLAAYVLYRDDVNNGNWHPVVGVAGSQTTLTDPNYSSYPNGNWRIETNWSISCAPTGTSTYSRSKSNAKIPVATGIMNLNTDELNVYPNPASNLLNITGIRTRTTVQLIDLIGKKVLETILENNAEINTSDLSEGVYHLSIKTAGRTLVKKLVIVR